MKTKKSLVVLMALALAACAPANVTPAPTHELTREPAPTQTPSPSGAEVKVLPTWTPQPTDMIPTPKPSKCPDLQTQPNQMKFAPISDKADIIAYTGRDGVFIFDTASAKSSLIISKTDDISLEQLAWSPDGKRLALVRKAFAGDCAGSQLILVDVISDMARVILFDDAQIKVLAWMSDSSAVTIQNSRGVMNFNSGGDVSYVQLPIDERVSRLEWVNVNNAWYIPEPAASGQIVPLTLLRLNPLAVRPALRGLHNAISISPNKKLLAVNWYDTQLQSDVLDILSLDAETLTVKTMKNIVGFTSVNWSPDSNSVLVGIGLGGVWLIEAKQNGAEKQLDFYGKPANQAWNADGSRMAVILGQDGSKEPPPLAIYTFKTNQLDVQPAKLWSPWEVVWRK
ncbi:MAG: hypothetical protein WAU96_16020 [Anaerolineae bacterium]|nr:hypothetical protein [Thermoflexales bacterium]